MAAMDDTPFRQQALAEAMHLADVKATHYEKYGLNGEVTADEVVDSAEKFLKFLKGESA